MAVNVCGPLDPADYPNPCPGDTTYCCDHDTRTWRCRSRGLPSGVAFSCPAPNDTAAFEAAAAAAKGCRKEQWQCRPPHQPILPLVKTPARMAAAFASAAATGGGIIPLVVPQEGPYSCGTADAPIALCQEQ